MEKNTLAEAREEIDRIDEEMARLFVRRMYVVSHIADDKQKHDLPIYDAAREHEVIATNAARVEADLRPFYTQFLSDGMRLSRRYQEKRMTDKTCEKKSALAGKVTHTTAGYDIHIGNRLLSCAGTLFSLNRRVLILSDDGVPAAYAACVAAQCKEPILYTIPAGEGSKTIACFEEILSRMLEAGFDRTDAVVAVGGGVVGDLCGFVASAYMRGIDFYYIPTTLLAQVDASVGGKTAVNLGGIKNCVGCFYPPKGVLIDPDVLDTLPPRQIAAGMAEVIKMAVSFDEALFAALEQGGLPMREMIARALAIKERVVAMDEKENGLRRALNFGHTIGHGIENCGGLYHGECVALGMLPMCAPAVRERLLRLYRRYGLPTILAGDVERVVHALMHDKKREGDSLHMVYVEQVGQFVIKKEPIAAVLARVREVYAQ